MAEIEIVETIPAHVLSLRETLREGDASEICKFGLPIRKALYRSYKNSIMCRTGLIDGHVGAIWGLGGVVLGEVGHPWLLTGEAVKHIPPLAFVRIYAQEVQEMLGHFPVLENWVDASYTKSVRLLQLIGFTLDAPTPWGRKSNALFRRFEIGKSDA